MNNKNYIFIANWKIYYSFNQALAWCKEHKQGLAELAQKNSIVLCPSYEALAPVAQLLADTPLALGAQNCSEHNMGAYTGQVAAQSLHELGVKYCIIGHHEVRTAFGDTHAQLLKKMEQLLKQKIVPIFCLGENKQDYEDNRTHEIMAQQLEPVTTLLKNHEKADLLIAYEPVWAIGTGIVANNNHISQALTFLSQALHQNLNQIRFLYGGTVTGETIKTLKEIDLISGFLIGKATTNFQELKKIVS